MQARNLNCLGVQFPILFATGTAYLNSTLPIGEELSILVKLLGEDAPQMAMSYILTQVAIEKDPEAEWQRSLW
nr:hypothetical protein CFP56_40501 [Quercus suber]